MTRHPNDYYPTPAWMTWCLKDTMRPLLEGNLLEPFAGRSLAIVKAMKDTFANIETNDIDLDAPTTYHINLKRPLLATVAQLCLGHDWVITNPPYYLMGGQYNHIFPWFFQRVNRGMALLIRQTWLNPGAQDITRTTWLNNNPPNHLIYMPRYKFTKSSKTGKWQTDACQHIWAIWTHDHGSMIPPISFYNQDQIPGFHDHPLDNHSLPS